MSEYNKQISNILFDIERTGKKQDVKDALDYVCKWCDNIEDCDTTDGYDFSNASWGLEEQAIIEHLQDIQGRALNAARRHLQPRQYTIE